MKKSFVSLAVVLAAIGSAHAQSLQNVYVQANVGVTKLDLSCDADVKCDESDVGMKALVGIGLGGGFSAELGYTNFGKFSASYSDGVDTVKASAKGYSLTLGGAYAYNITDKFQAIGRLGFGVNKAKLSASLNGESGSDSETTTQPYFGIGAAYLVDKNIAVGASWETTKFKYDGEKADASMLSAFVRYNF